MYKVFKLLKKFQEWEMGEKFEHNKNILPSFYYRIISDFSKAVIFLILNEINYEDFLNNIIMNMHESSYNNLTSDINILIQYISLH